MNLKFSDKPGARERQLKRKYNNFLFADCEITLLDIHDSQQKDAEEIEEFLKTFTDLVKQTAELEPNAEADVILKIKEQLDKAYEQCSGLAGDHADVKDMLKKLLAVIMQAMWKGIGQDVEAHSKLEMEEKARVQHFNLLECHLVVDLLRPDSPISEKELVPILLSESAESLKIAMQLFVSEQQKMLCQQARTLLDGYASDDEKAVHAHQRLQEMQQMIEPSGLRPS